MKSKFMKFIEKQKKEFNDFLNQVKKIFDDEENYLEKKDITHKKGEINEKIHF